MLAGLSTWSGGDEEISYKINLVGIDLLYIY